MYKLLFILALALTTQTVQAREKRDDTKYLAKGVVPTDNNGIVTFTQAFAVPGKSAAEIYNTMKQYLEGVEEAAMHDLRTKFMEQDAAAGLLVLRAEEWMVFKHKVFNLDRTRFRYHYQVKCSDGRCDMTITQITYYYEEDLDGSNGKTYKAEEWITDEESLNRGMTKLERFVLLLTVLSSALTTQADNLEVSVLTCEPGKAIYELYGHTAIRVRDVLHGERDAVFNYGVFDFNAPGFVPRFVRGETDYEVWAIPYRYVHD